MTNPTPQNVQPGRVGILMNRDFVQQLVDYLTTKPFKEVSNFITEIQKANIMQEPDIQMYESMGQGNIQHAMTLIEARAEQVGKPLPHQVKQRSGMETKAG